MIISVNVVNVKNVKQCQYFLLNIYKRDVWNRADIEKFIILMNVTGDKICLMKRDMDISPLT